MAMNKEKAIDKARKLLAMAADVGSPNEAAKAAKMARSLIDKFQIEDEDLYSKKTTLELDEEMTIGVNWAIYKKVTRHVAHLAAACAKYNDCQSLLGEKHGFFKVIFRGFEDDVLMADEMLNYFMDVMEKTMPNILGSEGAKDGYSQGFATEIHRRLEEESRKRRAAANINALVVYKLNLILEYFDDENDISDGDRACAESKGSKLQRWFGWQLGTATAKNAALGPSIQIGEFNEV